MISLITWQHLNVYSYKLKNNVCVISIFHLYEAKKQNKKNWLLSRDWCYIRAVQTRFTVNLHEQSVSVCRSHIHSPPTSSMMPPVMAVRALWTLSSAPQVVHFMPCRPHQDRKWTQWYPQSSKHGSAWRSPAETDREGQRNIKEMLDSSMLIVLLPWVSPLKLEAEMLKNCQVMPMAKPAGNSCLTL